jgi:hypothetical protein
MREATMINAQAAMFVRAGAWLSLRGQDGPVPRGGMEAGP